MAEFRVKFEQASAFAVAMKTEADALIYEMKGEENFENDVFKVSM